ncbi:alpha/beta fold hydrolase [Actinomadura atramentaria]|uniref:alpha/beta fold hydrolase n=1 Tax=Actinomadura atramentaria TaxID=1990 RepID=UPI0003724123|nr:alpha/beta hydrolase [Actinomadura atramentaria]
MDTTTGRLPVPGATLHYELRGTGPLLLISESGEGDAGRSADLAAHLAARHTVLTYDRRGLSRSVPDDPAAPASLVRHADDAARLLDALADGPATMLGLSIGAVIGLHLAVRRPDLLGRLIAFEPVAPSLLPAADAARHRAELDGLRATYRADGLAAVLPAIAATLGIDPHDPGTEPDVTPQPLTEQRRANFAHFIEREFPAVIDDGLAASALADCPVDIVPALGAATPPHVFDRRCAVILADLLGTAPAVLPGGHNGNTARPRAFAAALLPLLDAVRT